MDDVCEICDAPVHLSVGGHVLCTRHAWIVTCAVEAVIEGLHNLHQYTVHHERFYTVQDAVDHRLKRTRHGEV